MANVYHFNYISQLVKEKQEGNKESIIGTVKKRMLNYSEEQLCLKKKILDGTFSSWDNQNMHVNNPTYLSMASLLHTSIHIMP